MIMGDVEQLKQQIEILSQRIIFLEDNIKNNQKDLIKQALNEFTKKKKNPLKSELLRKFNKNKKSLIKQKILEALKTKPASISDLKYYIVDQLGYCSKASFYRYISEMKDSLEIKDDIAYLKTQVLV